MFNKNIGKNFIFFEIKSKLRFFNYIKSNIIFYLEIYLYLNHDKIYFIFYNFIYQVIFFL